MSESKLGVALVKEACPVCGKLVDGPIIMNTRLTKPAAEKVEELHGQTVGYMDGPCDECKEMMSQGFLLIGIIEEKSEPNNVYRNGNQWVLKDEAAVKIFGEERVGKGVGFIDAKLAQQMGLPDVRLEA